MRKWGMLLGVALAIGLLGGARPAAAQTIYTDRAAFNAAVGGALNFESFENNFADAASVTFGPVTVTEAGGEGTAPIIAQLRNYPGLVGGVPTHGTGAIGFDDNNESYLVFDFASPINAFGVDLAANVSSSVTVSGAANTTVNLAANTPAFIGIVFESGTFNQVVFNPSGGPVVGFDALAYGLKTSGDTPAVPEPGALALFLPALAVVGILKRRRS